MNKDSTIRHINRTLQQYYDTFGADSAEYHNLLRDLEYRLGDTTRTQSGGAAAYSRSAHTLAGMSPEKLEDAHARTKGAYSVNRVRAEVAEEVEEQGLEPTDENIRDYSNMKKEVSNWYNTIYKMFKEENPDSVSDFAGNDVDSQDDLVDKLGRIVKGRDKIRQTIQRAKDWDEKKKADIKDAAEDRPKQRLSPKESAALRRGGISKSRIKGAAAVNRDYLVKKGK